GGGVCGGHGPGGVCSKWIGRILGDREHLAVPLDARDEQAVPQLSRAVAELLAAGVPVTADRLYDHLDGTQPWHPDGRTHPFPPELPPPAAPPRPGLDPPEQTMPPAPWLRPADLPDSSPTPPTAAPPAVAVTTPGALAALWERVAAGQQQFLTHAAEAQRRFLQSQQDAEAALLAARAAFANRGWQEPTRPAP